MNTTIQSSDLRRKSTVARVRHSTAVVMDASTPSRSNTKTTPVGASTGAPIQLARPSSMTLETSPGTEATNRPSASVATITHAARARSSQRPPRVVADGEARELILPTSDPVPSSCHDTTLQHHRLSNVTKSVTSRNSRKRCETLLVRPRSRGGFVSCLSSALVGQRISGRMRLPDHVISTRAR